MKPILVGFFHLGRTPVRLLLDQSMAGSGSFNMNPDDGGTSEIRVSLTDSLGFEYTMAVLMHESMEFCLANMGCRYCACSAMNNGNSSDWMFVMDHQLFDRAVVDSTRFLLDCIEPLRKAAKKIK